MMDVCGDPTISTVVFMTSAQVGKTETLNNALAFFIDRDPCPILVVQPTLEIAEAWSKDRFQPMVRDCDTIARKVGGARSRTSAQTILHKVFPGGRLTISGANSPSSLASRPVRILSCDEVDRFPFVAGAEGDPVALAEKRTTTFWNRKHLYCSTPTNAGMSRIEKLFNESDQRFFHVPCPACGEFQRLVWANLRIKEDPVRYECARCAVRIDHDQKFEMLRAGKWVATREFNGMAGFHLSELYSPWVTWAEMAESFLKKKDDPEQLRVFVNTSLGEVWEDREGEKIDPESLAARRENYAAEVPRGVLVLTAGADVQGNRLEITVWGWGFGDESWVIEHKVFHGNPQNPDVWRELDAFLTSEFLHESGISMQIACVCVDSGNETQAVYDFTGPRTSRRVYAVKGSSQRGAPLVGLPTKRNRKRVPLWSVGTNAAKDAIFARLKMRKPEKGEAAPGFIHLPETVDVDFCEQLVAEKAVLKYAKGVSYREYIRTGRNEALDCAVYAMAARGILNPNYTALSNLIQISAPKAKTENQTTETPSEPPPRKSRPRVPPKRKGFARGW